MMFKKPEGMTTPFVNVHSHFIHYDFLPDAYTSNLITELLLHHCKWKAIKKLLQPRGILERIIHYLPFEKLLKRLAPIVPGRIGKILRALKKRNFASKGGSIATYIQFGKYMTRREIDPDEELYRYDIVIPLLMDLEQAAKESGEKRPQSMYHEQIEEISALTAAHPWQVFPFVMFHPGRAESLELCKKAARELGYVGVKLYPAMGFYPNPDHPFYNGGDEKKVMMKKQLEDFYAWADEKKLPITVHAQYYSMEKIDETIFDSQEYTRLSNWNSILENYRNIRLNFAHFGDVAYLCHHKQCESGFSNECRDTILGFMARYNTPDKVRIYADIAANYEGEFDIPGHPLKQKYFDNLNEAIKVNPGAVMFGTDTPVLNLKIAEQKYVALFDTHIKEHKERFFGENALDFIFGRERRIPDEYTGFLQRVKPEAFEAKPRWITREDGGYFVK